MNLIRVLLLGAAAVIVDGKGKKAFESLPSESYVERDHASFERRLSRAGSRDDGHAHEVIDVEFVGDVDVDERYDMEWETYDVNEALEMEEEITAQLERHLQEKNTKIDTVQRQPNTVILKGQSKRELEEDEEDLDYDYEVDELLDTDGRDLSHLRGKARKRNKRKKGKKRGKKKGKRGNKRGKKNKNKKKQGGRLKNPSKKNGGVYIYGNNGVVGNNQHNNLFNDNNRRPVCLEPADPYRTCYTRADDPNSKLNRDYIDRSGYNFGVKLYKQGYTYVDPKSLDPAYNTPLEPYTKPYTKPTEKLLVGTMWLTMLQDDTKVDCDAQISIEETTLKYLKENVGGPNTFEPICVFVKDSTYEKQELLDGSEDEVEVTVLELDITYVVKNSWVQENRRELGEGFVAEDDHEDERELMNSRCRPQDRAKCSSQFAINSKIGQFCKRKGCGRRGRQNRALHANRFNNLVKAETAFNPDQTNALLDMLDIDDVAMCATNRYAVEEMDDTTTLTCDQFGDFGCMSKNDDLLPMLTKANGACGSTTYLPTMFPTSFPTAFPTAFPTMSPTLEPTKEPKIRPKAGKLPTLSPTFLPTDIPTFIPTMEPTINPSLAPTLYPSLVPTVSPTLTPSLIPTSTPTLSPTFSPSAHPTVSPSLNPTVSPSMNPTISPSFSPTIEPTLSPTNDPTEKPTKDASKKRKQENKLFKKKVRSD